MIVSWVSFVIKPDVVPGRMGLLVTVFLVLINIFNGVKSNAPVSARVNAVDQYLLICIGLVFLALGEYTMVLCVRKNDPKQPSTTTVLDISGRIMSTRPEMEAEQHATSPIIQEPEKRRDCFRYNVDLVSLVIFPLVFVCFNIVYLIHHL